MDFWITVIPEKNILWNCVTSSVWFCFGLRCVVLLFVCWTNNDYFSVLWYQCGHQTTMWIAKYIPNTFRRVPVTGMLVWSIPKVASCFGFRWGVETSPIVQERAKTLTRKSGYLAFSCSKRVIGKFVRSIEMSASVTFFSRSHEEIMNIESDKNYKGGRNLHRTTGRRGLNLTTQRVSRFQRQIYRWSDSVYGNYIFTSTLLNSVSKREIYTDNAVWFEMRILFLLIIQYFDRPIRSWFLEKPVAQYYDKI